MPQNRGSATALSVRQPFALLISLGLRMVEFRQSGINLRAGDDIWIVLSQAHVTWDQMVQQMAAQHIDVATMQAVMRVAFDVHSLELNENTYTQWFSRGAVVGRVHIVVKKPSLLSWFHSLNPSPRLWDTALELDNGLFADIARAPSVSGAFPFPFALRWNVDGGHFAPKAQGQECRGVDVRAVGLLESSLFLLSYQ